VQPERRYRFTSNIGKCSQDIPFNEIPAGFVETTSETIRPRGFIHGQIFDNSPDFLLCKGNIKGRQVRLLKAKCCQVDGILPLLSRSNQVLIETHNSLLFVLLGDQNLISNLKFSNEILLFPVPSLLVEKRSICITFSEVQYPGTQPGDSALEGGLAKAMELQPLTQAVFLVRKNTKIPCYLKAVKNLFGRLNSQVQQLLLEPSGMRTRNEVVLGTNELFDLCQPSSFFLPVSHAQFRQYLYNSTASLLGLHNNYGPYHIQVFTRYFMLGCGT
jgi:hypothetical protein